MFIVQIITNQYNKELKQHGKDSFPFLISYECISKYESGSFMWHWHPEIEITYIQKGQMLYKVNRFTYHLKEGDLLFGNSNALHAGSMENLQDCEYVSITFAPKLIYGFSQSIVCTKYVESITHDFSLSAIHFDYSEEWHTDFASLVQSLIQLDKNKPALYELDIMINLQTLWKTILANHTSSVRCSAHDKTEYYRIKEIVSFIEHNYMRKFSLNDIATHINLCESECCRLFKRYMNISLFSFIQEYRIERSLDYLINHESIISIAEKVGFSDSNYYSKVFTKIKGCSPQKYRKRVTE